MDTTIIAYGILIGSISTFIILVIWDVRNIYKKGDNQ